MERRVRETVSAKHSNSRYYAKIRGTTCRTEGKMKRLLLTAMVCSYFSIACSAQGRATVSGGHLTTNNAVLDIVDTALTLPAVTAARIKITAGDTTLYAAMYDNETAREFMRLLPLTLTAFDRIGLVKSTVLPRPISDKGERTRT